MIGISSVTTVVDHAAIQRFLHSPGGPVATDILKRARRVQAAAKRQVGVRTGKLRRSIDVDLRTRPLTEAYVGSSVRYALLHHEGASAHTITAAPGRKLSFNQNGRRVFASKVLHPGAKPNRYLTDNLLRAVR